MTRLNDALARDRALVELERKADHARWAAARKRGLKELEREGLALRGLRAREDSSEIGRTLVIFDRSHGASVGGHRLSANDPVLVRPQLEPEGEQTRAMLKRITPRTVEILFDDAPEDWLYDDLCVIEQAPNDVTFDRLASAIDSAESSKGESKRLIAVLAGGEAVEPAKRVKKRERATFNTEQNRALDMIATQPLMFALHGPPGTGKTTTLATAILEAVAAGERVLVGTPSNQALDNIASQLLKLGVDIVRLGHPARADASLYAHTLEGKLENHSHKKVAVDLFKQARLMFREAAHKKAKGRAIDAGQQAFALRREAKAMLSEARKIEEAALEHVLDVTPVVLSTLTGLDERRIGSRRFALGVVDEATQAIRPAAYSVATRVDRMIFGGDHKQLGPTIISEEAMRSGLGRSVFEMLFDKVDRVPSVMLRTQYRMHEQIMNFPSASMYDGQLIADPSCKDRGLDDRASDERAVWFVDTAGRSFEESRAEEGSSWLNEGEAELAVRIAQEIAARGVSEKDIGLLSPYSAQVQKMSNLAEMTELDVNTIDGFQGREKEVIVVSLVRSNEGQEVGFLSDHRRMNVALTRARRLLVVIGDSATIASDSYYRRFVDDMIETGSHRTAWEWAS